MKEPTMLEALGVRTSSGCFLAVAFVVILGLFSGLGAFMQNVLGRNPTWAIAVGLIAATIAVIGFKRESRIVFRIAGTLLIVVGIGFAGFILFDFVKSMFTGHSVWAGGWVGRDRGIWTLVISGIGVTVTPIGWGMIQQARQ